MAEQVMAEPVMAEEVMAMAELNLHLWLKRPEWRR